MLAVAAPRSAASLRRARVLVAPRCAALEGPGAGEEEERPKIEEEDGNKSGERKKRARGRPVWRRILFASKKTRSIIMLNALTVIYGVRIFLSLDIIPPSSYYMLSCSISTSTPRFGHSYFVFKD